MSEAIFLELVNSKAGMVEAGPDAGGQKAAKQTYKTVSDYDGAQHPHRGRDCRRPALVPGASASGGGGYYPRFVLLRKFAR